jgi:hypothetical protein
MITRTILTGADISTSHTKVAPTHIGHESIFFASSRSSGVSGAKIHSINFPRKESVITLVLYVSFAHIQRASTNVDL